MDAPLRFGVDLGDVYRAEIRSPNGVVRGVYSFLGPDGVPHTIPYSNVGGTSGVDVDVGVDAEHNAAGGYASVPFSQLGIALPPYPYALYGANRVNKPPTSRMVRKRIAI